MNQRSTNIAFAILIGIILVMGYFLIFKQPVPEIPRFDDTALRKEIARNDSLAQHWIEESLRLRILADSLMVKNDSLEKVKPKIKNYYNEIYNFNATANRMQLDSVIRANW